MKHYRSAILGTILLLLTLSLALPSIRVLFQFAPIDEADISRVLVAAVATIGLLELIKAIMGSRRLA